MTINVNILATLDAADIDTPIPATARATEIPAEQGGGWLISNNGDGVTPIAFGLLDLGTVLDLVQTAQGVQIPPEQARPNDFALYTIGGFDRSGGGDSISVQVVTAGANRVPPTSTSRFNVGTPQLLAPLDPTNDEPIGVYAGQRIEVQPGGAAPLTPVLLTLVFEPGDGGDIPNPPS